MRCARLLRFTVGMLASASLGGCALVTALDATALNTVKYGARDAEQVDARTRELHRTLLVADLHADTLLLDRGGPTGIQRRHHYGHLDAPRLRDGNVGLQVLTVATVTPVPYCPNLNGGWILPNAQWLLSPMQAWPMRTWFDSRQHALYQAWKWRLNSSGEAPAFSALRTQEDLSDFLMAHYRRAGRSWVPHNPQRQPIATVLGLEGSHALQLRGTDSDARIAARVREFREAGFRMMALTHRFDNRLAGASEGARRGGVTPLGHRLLAEMERQGFMCDLAHASETAIRDVLDCHPRLPVLVSHGGIAFVPPVGGRAVSRQLSLESARRITARGGLLGIGLWPEAIGAATPERAAEMIRRCIDDPGIGPRRVALGSDMDGAVRAAFAADHYALLTAELGALEPAVLRDVMGGNAIRFFLEHLPSR